MSWFDRLAARMSRPAADGRSPGASAGRVSGEPRSSNGASSFHLFWELPGEFVAVAVTLEVVDPPTVPRLYFWALQVNFVEHGRAAGAGHLGLQHHPSYPGATAVNWGGYDASGRILDGTGSRLAGSLGNPHTRDLPWEAGRPYRLEVGLAPGHEQPGDGRTAWRGTVTDLQTARHVVVRDLLPHGSRLVRPMVWAEVFARCEHPATEVRWSEAVAITAEGQRVEPRAATTNYQRHEDGGCANTDSWADGAALVQRTNSARTTAQGSRLVLGDGRF
jgi:hypothetical protein